MSLKVLESYTRDVGGAIARLDNESMKELKTSEKEIIEIKGKKRTVATCMKLYPSDEGQGIIRIDGLTRNNSGTNIGDTVGVRKIKGIDAEMIVVAPLEEIPPIDERYLSDALQNVPVIKGDSVMVPYFGGRITLQVIGITPAADVVLITQKTKFHIAERGISMVEEEMNILSNKINQLVEKYDEQLINLLREEPVDEEKIIKTFDKMQKLADIVSYLSKKR